MFILLKMAESGEQIEPMDAVDDDARDESEIFISIKTLQDIQKGTNGSVQIYLLKTILLIR